MKILHCPVVQQNFCLFNVADLGPQRQRLAQLLAAASVVVMAEVEGR